MRGAAVAKKRGRPVKESGRSNGRIVISCTDEYEEYFTNLANELRTTNSGAFDRIVAEWAKANGHALPPPRI